jgi:L-asparaginase
VVVVTVFAYGDNMSAVRDPDAPRSEPRAESRAAAPGDSTRSDSTRTPALPPAPPMVTAQHLTPAKARILLMVALTRTTDPLEIQRYFLRY